MFLTHEGWRAWLARFERVGAVNIEPFADVMRYRHHTLIEVELAAPAQRSGEDSGQVSAR
jgi:hypothetical protein